MTARCTTRWKPAVGLASSRVSITRFSSSVSTYCVRFLRKISRSTLQARNTAEASLSSIRDSSKCSKVAYSCRRSLATASARCRVFSSARENDGIARLSLLFHDALQRMLVLAGVVHDLGHFGLGDLVSEHATLAHAVVVDVQHDLRRLFGVLVKVGLQNQNYKLHWRVIVIQQQNPIHARALGLCSRPCDDGRSVAWTFRALARLARADWRH